MKQSLDKDKGLSMQGILKDSLDYRQNYSIIIKFVLIGVALLSLFLGIIIIGEIFLYPLTIPALSNLLLIFIIVCVVMILLYRYLFQRR